MRNIYNINRAELLKECDVDVVNGTVFSKRAGRYLAHSGGEGCFRITVSSKCIYSPPNPDKKLYKLYRGRVVYVAAHGEIGDSTYIYHRNGDHADDRLANLMAVPFEKRNQLIRMEKKRKAKKAVKVEQNSDDYDIPIKKMLEMEIFQACQVVSYANDPTTKFENGMTVQEVLDAEEYLAKVDAMEAIAEGEPTVNVADYK